MLCPATFKNPDAHILSLKTPSGCHDLSCSLISWEGQLKT